MAHRFCTPFDWGTTPPPAQEIDARPLPAKKKKPKKVSKDRLKGGKR
jgi:hypothetical protein